MSFAKTWVLWGENHSSGCAAVDAGKIAMCSTLLQQVDGKRATLHKAFYPALKVDFGNNQAMWPCSHAKLAARFYLHPSEIANSVKIQFSSLVVVCSRNSSHYATCIEGSLSWFLQRLECFKPPTLTWTFLSKFGLEPAPGLFPTLPLLWRHSFDH